MMLIEPISKPVPSQGDTFLIGAFDVMVGRHDVMLEGDADQGLTARRGLRRRGARLGVLVDVLGRAPSDI